MTGPTKGRAKCFFLVDRRTTVKRQVSESQNFRPEREHKDNLVQLSFKVQMQLVQAHVSRGGTGTQGSDHQSMPARHIQEFPKMGQSPKDMF